MQSAETLSQSMIDGQLEPNNILEPRLIKAMEAVNRADFADEKYAHMSYSDGFTPLGGNRYMMSPVLTGSMLKLANLSESDKVLCIASGTGYVPCVAALLSKHVTAVEENQDLASRARALIKEKSISNIDIVSTPLTSGHADQAPYDVIIIQGSVEIIPDILFEQIAESGRVIFLKRVGREMAGVSGIGYLMSCHKESDRYEVEEHGEYASPMLPGFNEKEQFEF